MNRRRHLRPIALLAAFLLAGTLTTPVPGAAQGGLSLPPPPPLPGRAATGDPTSGRHLKKRVALMPVKVGRLSAELRVPGPMMASLVRDAIEAQLANAPGLLVVNRAELGDVVVEQQLAGSAAFNHELAPPARKLVPAQVLLYVSVDEITMSTNSREDVQSQAEDYVKQAQRMESAALEAQRRARLQAERLQRRNADANAYAGENDCNSLWPCALKTDPMEADFCRMMKRQCESQNHTLRQMAEMDRNSGLARDQQQIDEQRREVYGLESSAESLRRQAEWAPTEVTKRVHRQAGMELVWKAIDTATGQVVGSGSVRETASLVNRERSVQAGYQSSRTSNTARVDTVVQMVLDRSIARLVPDVDRRLATEPFRAKVVDLTADGRVVVNAGSNYGLRKGDTFGVRDVASVLTDPDTGELLTVPGPPEGILWITEVADKVSFARVVRAVGRLGRGDELEWIGHFAEQPSP